MITLKIRVERKEIYEKKARLFALLLAMAMILSLAAACSGSESSTDSTSSDDTTAETDTNGETLEEESDDDVWDGEITEINIYLMDLRGISENAQPIVDAMNAITETTIGVTANFTYVSTGDYDSKLTLAISGGEQVDLCMIAPLESTSFTSLIANGQLMDITEYMQDEGAETLELVGDYIEAYTVSGSIYGVPAYRNYSSSVYINMRKDVLEDLGLLELAENMTTWSELEEIYAAVAENTDLSPVGGQQNVAYQTGNLYAGDAFTDTISFDALSDDLMIVYTDDDGNVSLLPETEGFQTQMEMMQRWYENGWIYQDSIVTGTDGTSLIKSGVLFSTIGTSELGVETSLLVSTGYECICVEVSSNMLSSTYVNKFGMGVPVTAEEPEAAIRWLNALYNSEELMNLIVWGIEGEDYVVTEDGVATYPDGIDADTVSYHTADFLYGNYFLVLPWEDDGSDFREVAYEALLNAPVSDYLGFTIDLSEQSNLIAAVTSVVDQYKGTILCGAFSDDDYASYLAALQDAGVETLLDVYQEQLDEWLAAK